jgi:Vacuolar sorting 38 and autophagy-related subunit 14
MSSSQSPVLCPTCVQNSLQTLLEQRRVALEERDQARENCAARLAQLQQEPSLSELAYESESLRQELGRLRHDCSSLAVKVAAQVVKNDERRAHVHAECQQSRQQLSKLQESLVLSAMPLALEEAKAMVRVRRFQLAIQVFDMHKLQVGEEQSMSSRQRHARGIGKLGGLPLPHAGPELYGVLPPQELSSALRLVASLTSTVAQCLGIVLPHPILLQRGKSKGGGDIIETCVAKPVEAADSIVQPSTTLMSSISSLWTKKPATRAPNLLDDQMPPSMDRDTVAERLQHARHAVLAENESRNSCSYVLSASNPDEFAIGLQLLQNDTVALCIRAGVLIEDLWPAEALLLNLQALFKYCQKQVKGGRLIDTGVDAQSSAAK